MKLRFALAASILVLAACQPSTPPAGQAPAGAAAQVDMPPGPVASETSAGGCSASAGEQWGPVSPGEQPSYRIEAFTNGSICEAAVVTLVIRARDGFASYVWAGQAQHLFGLNDVTDVAAMLPALAAWMDPAGSSLATTGDLPPWDETEGQARQAEFPFMPAEGIDKQTYEQIRAAKTPAYCFPQGMESLMCVALRDGEVQEIGLQLFPG